MIDFRIGFVGLWVSFAAELLDVSLNFVSYSVNSVPEFLDVTLHFTLVFRVVQDPTGPSRLTAKSPEPTGLPLLARPSCSWTPTLSSSATNGNLVPSNTVNNHIRYKKPGI